MTQNAGRSTFKLKLDFHKFEFHELTSQYDLNTGQ